MISVIIPSYNYGHLISETFQSILNQTYQDWEIIVVDDGSKDNTEQVVQAFIEKDNRFSYYKQQNAGPSAARNKALSVAKGNYIQFLDADDLIEKKKFEVQIKIFQDNTQADVVYGNVRYFIKDPADEESRSFSYWGAKKEWLPKLNGPGLDLLVEGLKGGLAHLSTYIFKKSLLDRIDPWDEKKRAAEDYLYILNCMIANGYFINHNTTDTFALVRWHENNVSRNIKWIREGDLLMRIELRPRLLNLNKTEVVEANEQTIKALELMIKDSWRSKFLSGGPFDLIKKVLKFVGLEKVAKKVFYK